MEARRDYLFAQFVKVGNGLFQGRKLMISCGRKD